MCCVSIHTFMKAKNSFLMPLGRLAGPSLFHFSIDAGDAMTGCRL